MTSVTPLPAKQTTSDSDSESELDDSQQSPEFLRRLEQFKKKQHSKLFLFFEEPSSSRMAQHFANIMTVVVVVSIIGFCLETENVSFIKKVVIHHPGEQIFHQGEEYFIILVISMRMW